MEQTYDKNPNMPISWEQRPIAIAECESSYHVSDNEPVQIIGRYGRSSSSILNDYIINLFDVVASQ